MKDLTGAVKLSLTLLIVPLICVLSIFRFYAWCLLTIFSPLDDAKERGDAKARDLGDLLMEGLSLLEIFVD
jgi:hypothetical protein